MPTYTVSPTHGLLTDEAQALGERFVEYVELAEDVLRLKGTTFTGAAQAKAIRAIVLQVNRIALLLGSELAGAGLITAETQGDQSRTYAEGASQISLDPTARQLVEDLGIVLERRRVPSLAARAEYRSTYPK